MIAAIEGFSDADIVLLIATLEHAPFLQKQVIVDDLLRGVLIYRQRIAALEAEVAALRAQEGKR